MSDDIGPLFYGSNNQEVFLGYSMGQQAHHASDEVAGKIDGEVKRIVADAHAKATHILTEHLDELHIIAQAMLEYETLSGDEIKALMRGEKIRRPDEAAGTKSTPIKSPLPSSRKG